MASTEHEPISITFFVRNLGTVVVIPNQDGQDQLSNLSRADLKRVTRALARILKTRFKRSGHMIRDVIDNIRLFDEQVRRKVTGEHITGALSEGDHPDRPFAPGRRI